MSKVLDWIRREPLSALGLVAMSLIVTGTVACTTSGLNVSMRDQIGRIPISAEGRWHDLEALSLDRVEKPLRHLFSRGYLMRIGIGEHAPAPPLEPEEYHTHLRALDTRLAAAEERLKEVDASVRNVMLYLLRLGTMQTSRPQVLGSVRMDELGLPVGPNRCVVDVTYWPGGTGARDGVLISVEFVQEFEDWRIDNVTPNPFLDPSPVEFWRIEPIPGRRPIPTRNP